MLNTCFIELKGSRKLKPRFIVHFKILKCISPQVYKLAIPISLANLHYLFQVSLLHPYCHGGDRKMVALLITLDGIRVGS